MQVAIARIVSHSDLRYGEGQTDTMQRRLFLSAATYLAALFGGASANALDVRLVGDAASAAAIWSSFRRWLIAYEEGDLEGIMLIFDPEVIFSFQGSKDQSLADLRRGYEADLSTRTPGSKWVPRVEEVYAEESLGFVRAIWELQIQDAGATQVKDRNRSLDVFRRRDAQWRIIRSINYPEKLSSQT